MEYLIGCAGTVFTLLAFIIGFFFGRFSRMPQAADPAPTDEEKLRTFKEELKAFDDCMNYSIDVAYGGGKA